MGNRAVVQFEDGTGIYLHWNGGPESVLAFLDAAKKLGVRTNEDYGVARLVQIIGNWFGGSLSLGVGQADGLDRDNHDNGTYLVDGQFNIASRLLTKDSITSVDQLDSGDLKKYNEILAEVVAVNEPIFKKGS